jgi:ferrous-iron efflux pump FieF
MRMATYASVFVACVLIVLKLVAYVMTGSVALLSSLIDSSLDAFASIINLFAVRHALEPADAEHRFGHGKAEALAGLAQATFIMASSLFLVFEALNHLYTPQPIEHGAVGIVVIVISLISTIALVSFQKYVVKRTNSLAIHADSIHYMSDIGLNIAVIAALVITIYFDMPLADPIFAIIIAAYIVWSAWSIVKNASDQLMDRELPDEDRDKIRTIGLKHPKVEDIHELRTRMAGRDIFIQFHLEMDGEITLNEAHIIADEVELDLLIEFPGADIMIHEDPENDQPGGIS